VNVPFEVKGEEKIIRAVYSNMNFKKNEMKDNVLRSPKNKDEISVTRLDYCDIEFCRKRFKNAEAPEKNRSYWGFFMLLVNEVRNVGSEVVSTQDSFKEHADIKHGYIELEGQEPSLEVRIKIDKLFVIAKQRLRRDITIDSPWEMDLN
jgi:hypothetical protein